MPLSYMGSKRKSAHRIFNTITNHSPEGDTLVDLFCGGLAISELFFKRGWTVIANDKNKYLMALLDQAINKGLDDAKCTSWVSREAFKDITENPNKYEDWYVGYVQCLWSFGNTQVAYMFGKDIEEMKRLGHIFVVDKDASGMEGILPQKCIDGILRQPDWHLRRMALGNVCRVLQRALPLGKLEKFERLDYLRQLQQLQRLESLEQLEKLTSLNTLQHMEQLMRMESLQQMQVMSKIETFETLEQNVPLMQLDKLKRLESDLGPNQLTFTSVSYEQVEIPPQAVIYCDPPYKGTAEYKEGNFDHKSFWDWVRKKSETHRVFVSEYHAPDDFKPLLQFSQKSTLQGGSQQHNNQPNECLFTIK